ncbi:MAG: sugar nucleotide-binding protein, partial [Bacteroidaceae bacterium]|nr:sugar nucleotide-binding protein [Bacteroidaceae bacterium]
MNILVTGANGQLGNEMRIVSIGSADRYVFSDVNDVPGQETLMLDITDSDAVRDAVKEYQVDIIVNCAAYTNVDKAEIDEDVAHKINSLAVENLGLSGARVIHISTDYVFSGEACVPYAETDSVAPRTAYGRTKREGEVLLQAVSS